jgi:hypothetical protein
MWVKRMRKWRWVKRMRKWRWMKGWKSGGG